MKIKEIKRLIELNTECLNKYEVGTLAYKDYNYIIKLFNKDLKSKQEKKASKPKVNEFDKQVENTFDRVKDSFTLLSLSSMAADIRQINNEIIKPCNEKFNHSAKCNESEKVIQPDENKSIGNDKRKEEKNPFDFELNWKFCEFNGWKKIHSNQNIATDHVFKRGEDYIAGLPSSMYEHLNYLESPELIQETIDKIKSECDHWVAPLATDKNVIKYLLAALEYLEFRNKASKEIKSEIVEKINKVNIHESDIGLIVNNQSGGKDTIYTKSEAIIIFLNEIKELSSKLDNQLHVNNTIKEENYSLTEKICKLTNELKILELGVQHKERKAFEAGRMAKGNKYPYTFAYANFDSWKSKEQKSQEKDIHN